MTMLVSNNNRLLLLSNLLVLLLVGNTFTVHAASPHHHLRAAADLKKNVKIQKQEPEVPHRQLQEPTDSISIGSSSTINLCFCQGCTAQVQDTMAGDHSCRDRIEWLQKDKGYTEIGACRKVAGTEHPDKCGACNPDTCVIQPICGNGSDDVVDGGGDEASPPPTSTSSCTVEILETPACSESFDGCHQCGERFRYLVESKGRSVADTCETVARRQFPEECGACIGNGGGGGGGSSTTNVTSAPSMVPSDEPSASPTNMPTHVPTSPPSESPSTIQPSTGTTDEPTTSNIVGGGGYASADPQEGSTNTTNTVCGTAMCTPEVWDTLACKDTMGGCHSCGDRITYLIEEQLYAPNDACEIIGYKQFMSQCGGCMPDHLRRPVLPVDPSKLVWSDEFDTNGAPDPTKWSFDIGSGDWGWGNNELQYYTDRLDNSYCEDGILKVRAVKEEESSSPLFGGKDYTSARLKSKFQGDWTYGRIQIRARLPQGAARGTWAAAWMLSTDDIHGGWPDSGEIDILEHVGYDPGVFHGTVHTDAFNHMKGTQSGGDVLASVDDWHVFEIDWSADKIDFIIDNFRYHTFSRQEPNTFREWPFDERFHVILNVAVGGNWGGIQGVDVKAFEGAGQIMEIDWVRVYSE